MMKCKYHMAFLKRSLRPDFPKTPAYPKTISSEMLLILTINQNILTIHEHIHRKLLVTSTNKGKNAQITKARQSKVFYLITNYWNLQNFYSIYFNKYFVQSVSQLFQLFLTGLQICLPLVMSYNIHSLTEPGTVRKHKHECSLGHMHHFAALEQRFLPQYFKILSNIHQMTHFPHVHLFFTSENHTIIF